MSAPQIRRLEALLERVRQRARGPRPAGLAERPRSDAILLDQEPPHAKIEVVESALPEELGEDDVLDLSSDVLDSVPPPPAVVPIASVRPATAPPTAAPLAAAPLAASLAAAPPTAPPPSWNDEPEELGPEDLPEDMGALEEFLRAAEEEERAPASSKRHRIAIEEEVTGTLSASAVREQLLIAEEHEVPLKTPPPESGPQEAPAPGLASPPSRSELLDELPLEPDVALELAQASDAESEDAPFESEAAHASALLSQPPAASQVTLRSPLADVAPATYARPAAIEAPPTFAELLDASLRLGA